MKIEDVFNGNESLTFEQFKSKMGEAKFVDLSEGGYVSKRKYDDDISAKAKEIETLNGTISTRDTDLAELKKKLEEAGTDAEKLTTLNNQFTELQGKYDADVKAYKAQLAKQSYEFAAREYANKQKFTSEAARRDFIRELNEAGLKMDKNGIMGADDFRKTYEEKNSDAFIKDPAPNPAQNDPPKQTPQFVGSTPGDPSSQPKMTLSEMMKAKNENPNLSVNF